MRLKRINIVGFKNITREIKFEFSNEQTTIIYGNNGCGKTTFLQILHAVFLQDEAILINNKVKNIEIEFELNGKINKIGISEIIDNSTDFNKRNQYNWDDFGKYKLGNVTTLLVGIDRGATTNTNVIQASMITNFFRISRQGNKFYEELGASMSKIFAEQLAEYLTYSANRRTQTRITMRNIFDDKHLYLKGNNVDINVIEETIMQRYNQVKDDASKKMQSALFETFSEIINENTNKDSLKNNLEFVKKELEPNYLLISKSLGNIPDSKNNDVLISIKDKSLEELLEECNNKKHICLLMKNIIKNIIPEREILNSVLMLQDKFNAYLINGKQMNISDDGISIKLKDGKHRLNELSSGEVQFLTLLTCFIIDSSKRDIIMIDEPELSLNNSWQNELINLIGEFSPEMQIIVSTHSPAIAEQHIKCIRELL